MNQSLVFVFNLTCDKSRLHEAFINCEILSIIWGQRKVVNKTVLLNLYQELFAFISRIPILRNVL